MCQERSCLVNSSQDCSAGDIQSTSSMHCQIAGYDLLMYLQQHSMYLPLISGILSFIDHQELLLKSHVPAEAIHG